MSPLYTLLIFGTVFILLGSAVTCVLYNKNAPSNRAFAATLLLNAIWLTSLYYSIPASTGILSETIITYTTRLSYSSSAFFLYLMLLFLSIFIIPTEKLPIFQGKVPKTLFYILRYLFLAETLALTIVTFFTPLVYDHVEIFSIDAFADHFGFLAPWMYIHYYMCLILSVLIPIAKIFFTKGLARKKLLYIFITYGVCTFLALTFNVVLPIYSIFDYYLLGGVSYLPLAFVTLYIIAKYRFLGSQFALGRILRVFMSLTGTVLVAYAYENFANIFITNTVVHLISIILISIIAYRIFYDLVFKSLFYFRNYQLLNISLEKLKESLKYTTEFSDFAEHVRISFTEQLGISSAEIFIVDKTIEHRLLPTYPSNELTNILKTIGRPLIADELEYSERPLSEDYYKAFVQMNIIEASVCIPLFFRSELIGFLSLGKKYSNEIYFQEEIDGLSSLSDYIAIFLVNDSLRHKDQTQSAELERSKQVYEDNERAKRLMHDMKNSLQSALAVVREVKENENLKKVWRIEESLWNIEDSLTSRNDKLEKKIMSIEEFFDALYNTFADLFAEKNIHFTWKGEQTQNEFFYIDRRKMRSIMENLLHNAYKFTPQNGIVSLNVVLDHNLLKIDVINSGAGISLDSKKKIFEKGYTTDNVSGSGIGLANVKDYIEAHNGQVTEVGKPGKNAHFKIVLPKGEPEIHVFNGS